MANNLGNHDCVAHFGTTMTPSALSSTIFEGIYQLNRRVERHKNYN